MTPAEIEELTFSNIPKEYFRRALQAVFLANSTSWDDSRANYHEEEAENVRPYMRRGKLEGFLRDAAALVPGVEARVVKGEKSGWYHTEIRGGPVVLTENSVPTPGAMVAPSEFRESLALDNQLTLFDLEEPDEAEHLYAVLIHSRFQRWNGSAGWADRRLPGSAYLAFPAPGLKQYVHSINLFDMFPDVVAANIPATWNDEAVVQYKFHATRGAWAL